MSEIDCAERFYRKLDRLSTAALVCYILLFVFRKFELAVPGYICMAAMSALGIFMCCVLVKNGKKLKAVSKSGFYWRLALSLIYCAMFVAAGCEFLR